MRCLIQEESNEIFGLNPRFRSQGKKDEWKIVRLICVLIIKAEKWFSCFGDRLSTFRTQLTGVVEDLRSCSGFLGLGRSLGQTIAWLY